MVGSWCNMEGSGMVGDRHGMDGGGVVEGGCMVGNCMVSNRVVNRGSMVSNRVVDGSSMVSNRVVSNGVVSNSVVRCSMVNNRMVRVRVSHNVRWDNVSVLVQDGFGQVGIEQGVCVETVEGDGRAAVDCVPELAPGVKIRKLKRCRRAFSPEQVLIEECPVGADEPGSLRSVPSVVANPVRLGNGD